MRAFQGLLPYCPGKDGEVAGEAEALEIHRKIHRSSCMTQEAPRCEQGSSIDKPAGPRYPHGCEFSGQRSAEWQLDILRPLSTMRAMQEQGIESWT